MLVTDGLSAVGVRVSGASGGDRELSFGLECDSGGRSKIFC